MVIFYSYVKLPEGKVKIKYYMWFPKKSYGLRMIYRYTPFLFPRAWCSYKVGIPLTTARVNSPHSIYRWFCCYVGKIWESIVLHKLEIIHFWNDSSRIHHQLNGDLLLPLSFSQKLYPHFRSNPLPAAKGTLRGQATSMGELSQETSCGQQGFSCWNQRT